MNMMNRGGGRGGGLDTRVRTTICNKDHVDLAHVVTVEHAFSAITIIGSDQSVWWMYQARQVN